MLSCLAMVSVGACVGVFVPPAQSGINDKVQISADTIASFASYGVAVTPDGAMQAGVIDVGRNRDLWIVGNGEWIMSDRETGKLMFSGTVWSGVGDAETLRLRLVGPTVVLDGSLSPDLSGDGTLDFQGRLDWGKVNAEGVPARLLRQAQGEVDDAVGVEVCLCVCSNGDFVYTGCSILDCQVQNRCEAGSCPPAQAVEPAPAPGEGDGEVIKDPLPGDIVPTPLPRQRNTSCRNIDPNGSWLAGVGFLMAVGSAGGVIVRRRRVRA